RGLLAGGVPAAQEAMVTALVEFGSNAFAEVAEPALALAEGGFPMHVGLAGQELGGEGDAGAGASIRTFAEIFRTRYPSTARIYLPNDQVPRPGDIIQNPALARFFKRLLDAEASVRSRGRKGA